MIKKLGSAGLAFSLMLQPAAPFAAELTGPIELPALPIRSPGVPEPLAPLGSILAPELGAQNLSVPGALPTNASLPAAEGALSGDALPKAAQNGALPRAATARTSLTRAATSISAASAGDARAESADRTVGFVASQELFDGHPAQAAPVGPSFEPPMGERMGPPSGGGDGNGGGERDDERNDSERPTLSFPQSVKGALLAVDPAKSIYATAKVVRDTPKKKGERQNGSEKYWSAYKKGVEIDVTVGNENVFGRTTKITYAATKKIREMQKEDFKGLVPAFQLQLGIRELRQKLIERLEENRAFWHRSDPAIGLDSRVRLVKFQSYIDLYKEVHGKDAAPQPEPKVERAPLELEAKGKLEPLTRFPPRLIFLDIDAINEPLNEQQLADMAELQRTGVYFVAFSRRPFDAPGGMKDILVKNMSGSQLTAQMPNRFLAVTDDGAVISKFRKDGAVVPVDALKFTPGQADIVADAVQRGAEASGIPAKEIGTRKQPAIFVEGSRWNPFKREKTWEPEDPRVRLEFVFPKGVSDEQLGAWSRAFMRRVGEEGLKVVSRFVDNADGTRSLMVEKTDIHDSLDRVYNALGEEFGMYATPTKSDIVVIADKTSELRRVNPNLDLAALTDLKGPKLVENVLGLILGEARKGGKKGSASRMISFTGYRERYMSEFIIAQDAAEENINFFSGHMVHANNDWLVSQLQHGRVPTPEEYERQLRDRWNKGLRETKPVGIPKGTRHERLLNASVRRGLQMYKHVVAAHNRGEILVGTEIPNFIVIETYKRGEDGKFKDRYIVHTIFDFIALRPDPSKPGHASLVTYDFKTGPAKSVQKLEKDDQVLTYSLFNYERWVGRPFPVPYLSGDKSYIVDDAVIEFIYNLVQKPTITPYDREKQRARIPRVFDAIARTEAKLMGVTLDGRPLETKKKKKGAKAPAPKGPRVKIDKSRPAEGSFETLTLPRTVPGIKIKREFAQQIVKGVKKIEYRSMSTKPKPFVAIIQTFTDEEPGRPAEVVGFARIEKVTGNGGEYEYHLSHVTPVKPYVVPNNKPGAIIWVKDVPVQGPKRLKS